MNLVNPYIFAASGAPAAPSTIASIWDWWEVARETSYADNDPMDTLTGQFAAKVFSASGASRPTFKTNKINGLPAATINNQAWGGVNASALTAGHVFFLLKATNDPGVFGSTTPCRIGSSGNLDNYPFTDGVIYCGIGSTTRRTTVNPAASLTSYRVLEVVTTATEYTVKLDGTQLFTSGTNTVGFSSDLQLGKGPATAFNGEIEGLYIFSAKLSAGDRTTQVNYLNTEFALSIT